MRIHKASNWDRAVELYEGAKLDLGIATAGAAFAGLATLDAHFSWFANGRMFAGVLAVAVGSGAALLGLRAGLRAIGAAAHAAIAGAQYLLGSAKLGAGQRNVAGAASAEGSTDGAIRDASAP